MPIRIQRNAIRHDHTAKFVFAIKFAINFKSFGKSVFHTILQEKADRFITIFLTCENFAIGYNTTIIFFQIVFYGFAKFFKDLACKNFTIGLD